MSGKIRIAKTVQSTSFSLRCQDVKKNWILIDAEGVILGRLAAFVATRLRGKHSATFTPSVDCGDNVVIINAEKVKMTGNKAEEKNFYYHTGHPGGIKARTRAFMLSSAHPERVIQKAVQRMLPKGPLGMRQLANLKVCKGAEHPYAGNKPVKVDFASLNPKNKKG